MKGSASIQDFTRPLIDSKNGGIISASFRGQLEELEKQATINEIVVPFLEWCYQEAFNLNQPSPNKYKQRVLTGTGIIIGGLSVASIFPLGGSFGNVVSDYIGLTDPDGRNFIYNFFATNALIPMLCLSCIEAKDWFKSLATSALPNIKKKSKNLRTGLITVAYIFAVFSALSPMYANIEAFSDSSLLVKILTTPTSFIGPLIFKSAAEVRLIDRTMNYFTLEEKSSVSEQRKLLQEKLTAAVKIITSISDSEIEALFFDIFEKYSNIESKQSEIKSKISYQNLSRLIRLHSQNSKPLSKTEKIEEEKIVSSKGSSFFKMTGFIMGAISAYTYYTLAESATLYLCDFFGIDDEDSRQILKEWVASMAVVPWAALGAEATYFVFEKIYNIISDYKRTNCCKFLPIFSVFEGVCASTPPTYLAIQALSGQAWYSKLLIIPAFLGPASIRTVAVHRLTHEATDWLSRFSKKGIIPKRKLLIESINKINSALDKISDNQIMQLYTDFMISRPELLNTTTIQTSIDGLHSTENNSENLSAGH